MLTDEIAQNLTDPIWRIKNLYHVKDPKGKIVPFVPSPEQEDIIHAIYEEGLEKIIILKARQLGMSTVIDIILTDKVIWEKGIQAAIVDLTQSDASKKLENKVRLAWNKLPSDLRSLFNIGKDSGKQFQIQLKQSPGDGWNEVQAGMNARGDTFQILHISEWGAIQHEDENRSVEILTGALPAAKEGIVIVETTWKGGKGGPLWELTQAAINTPTKYKTKEDFTLFFFPWFTDERYYLEGDTEQITEECHEYLDRVEQETDFEITPPQRLWYFKVAMSKGFYRFREYPSTLEECFKGHIEGAIYQDLMLKAHADGRIKDFPQAHDQLTHTFWDLGSPKNTATWCVQFVGREIHLVDLICEEDLTLVERIAKLHSLPYNFGNHYLPHDAQARERAGLNFVEQASQIGLRNIIVLPKPHSIWPGINHLQQIFNRILIRKSQCERGIAALEAYRTAKNKTLDYQTDMPVHDWTSHICDPLRIMAEADMNNMFSSQSQGVLKARRNGKRRPQLAKV